MKKMEEIAKYIEKICDLEYEAQELYNKEETWEIYNEVLERMNNYLPENFKNDFGMIPISEPESKEYYERVKDLVLQKRKLYKISKYSIGGDTYYLCYVSAFHPLYNMIGNCWICKLVEGEPVLYSTFIVLVFDEEEPIQWIGGANDLDINQFRNPVESFIYNEANITDPIEQDIIDNR
jgi:hypothetical protein